MPYIAQRKMRIMGTDYVPGEQVPPAEVGARALRSLLGRGHVLEVDVVDTKVEDKAARRQAREARAGG